jgi:hypothetical protein
VRRGEWQPKQGDDDECVNDAISSCRCIQYVHTVCRYRERVSYIPAHVAHFPVEEFAVVHELESDRNGESVQELSVVQLPVLVAKGQDGHGPENHTGAAIGKLLDIPTGNMG